VSGDLGEVCVPAREAAELLDRIHDAAIKSGDPSGPAWDLYMAARPVLDPPGPKLRLEPEEEELDEPPDDPPTPVVPEELAQLFHEVYERKAPEHGYRTREASAVPWDQVPERNRDLMIATASEVLARLEPHPWGLRARWAPHPTEEPT